MKIAHDFSLKMLSMRTGINLIPTYTLAINGEAKDREVNAHEQEFFVKRP
jgi:hypothetical protein